MKTLGHDDNINMFKKSLDEAKKYVLKIPNPPHNQ